MIRGIKRYYVTTREQRGSLEEWTDIFEAYTAADAVTQAEVRYQGCYPTRSVVGVAPAGPAVPPRQSKPR